MNQNIIKIRIFLNFMLIFFSFFISAQQKYLDHEVAYLSVKPKVDGKLDSNLLFLKKRYFLNNDKGIEKNIDVSYRIAYGANFFYVFMEATADSLTYRDRAYQNGDGFQRLLAKPQVDKQTTGEFYVLACSAVNKKSMEWSRNICWYYNVEHIFKKTSQNTELRCIQHNDKISFELILPWKDVYPYHPWISDQIGFNLCFVKAIGESNKMEFKVLKDELGAENSNRKYVLLKFQTPDHKDKNQTYLILNKNNVNIDQKVTGTIVTIASKSSQEHLLFKIKTGENSNVAYNKINYSCKKGVNKINVEILKKEVPPGGYKIEWYNLEGTSSGSRYFTVLPKFDTIVFSKEIELLKNKITESSYNTLKYRLFEIKKELKKLKAYETSSKLRFAIYNLKKSIEEAKNGVDVLAHEKGHYVYKHGLKGLIKGTIAIAVVSYVTGDVSFIATALPTAMVTSKYSREFETQADKYAKSELKRLNIPSKPLVKMFIEMEKY
ncbi:MAG: M48 family metalloprotease, partial [Bacteroidales bacterium]|nr:M48 family metalloprotease [Bacteroidales bacterium]